MRGYDGTHLGPPQVSEIPVVEREDTELFQWTIANPVAPGFFYVPPPGVDLFNDNAPDVRDAFALEGRTEGERLSQSLAMADFNGDGADELLVLGERATYLLFGPVSLNDIEDVGDIADLIIDADVGRPASRMGDVTGDGLADLVFVKTTTSGVFAITIIAGGNGGGFELPRIINQAWIDSTAALPGGNQRVKVRTGSGVGSGFSDPGASLAVLNWNDDGKADILLVRSATTPNNFQGF